MRINENFAKLPGSYLFSEIARRVAAYTGEHPEADLIRLGIGDVTLPLAPAVLEAMHRAVDEQGRAETFRGYGPEQGWPFLREAMAQHDFQARGVDISPEEIFISDGAKSDCGNIVDLFGSGNKVAVCDPVYPVYVDSNAMAGRAGEYDPETERWTGLLYMPCTAENGFFPELPKTVPDMIYLCFPNNPTGMAATKAQLKPWVDYANEHGSVILYDAAYRAYMSDPELPRTIYEIPGAEECAIEFCSFSKTAGFTGTRCGWTVIPRALKRGGVSLYDLWMRRQSTKFNGTAYVIQKAAEATYSEAGKAQIAEMIGYYMNNARVIRAGLTAAGLEVYGGTDSPYIWFRAPGGLGSWEFFDRLLAEANVVTTPGAGFGPSGEGFIRLTAFGDAENTAEAVQRIKSII